jgi:predicted aspartyl protease
MLCTPPLRADDVPDSATIRAHIADAQGPAPTNFRETIVGNGTLGTSRLVHYHRGSDDRTVYDRGPVHVENGTYKGDRWHQEVNGITVIDPPASGEARGDVTTTTVRHVTSPVDAYVVSTMNVRNQGTRDYVDPNTWLVMRREFVGPGGTTTVTYDRYASFGRRTLPAHWTDTGTKGTVTVYERTDYAQGDVTDDNVAIPPIRRELVTFPAGSTREELPVRIINGLIIVPVTIGGKTFDFILDSGSSRIAIDAGAAHEAGLTPFDKIRSTGVRIVDSEEAVVPSLRVGNLEMRDIIVNTLPRPLARAPGIAKIVGLLGFDFLATLGVTVDYEHGKLYAARAGSYTMPEGANVLALPIRLSNEVPLTTVDLDGRVADRMVIDTGFGGSFVLFDTFLRKYPTLRENNTARDARFFGVGGIVVAHPYTIGLLTVGKARFRDVSGYGIPNRAFFRKTTTA